MTERVVVAFGSNIGDRSRYIEQAADTLRRTAAVISSAESFQSSPVYESRPLTFNAVPTREELAQTYLNGAFSFYTALSPTDLLALLLRAERALGRDRAAETVRWGPRRLDLDIIAYGSRSIETDSLIVPHPRMHERDFVLRPLCDLWPEWRHPRLGKSAVELLAALPHDSLSRFILL